MNRGPVIHRVVLVPIQICTHQEGDKRVAVMPGWTLPIGMIAEGSDEDEAISALRQMMSGYWEGRNK